MNEKTRKDDRKADHGQRHFKSLDDYKAQRNAFLGEYTSRLANYRN